MINLGKYKKDYQKVITTEEVKSMIEKTYNVEHKVLIALLYITGARPVEILDLKANSFEITDNELRILVTTKKRGINRLLCFDMETPFVKDLIIPYVNDLVQKQKDNLFSFKTSDRVRQIVYSLSDNKITPYAFRHNRLTQLALSGATPYELMIWKGSKSLESVSPYIYRSPDMLLNLKNKVR